MSFLTPILSLKKIFIIPLFLIISFIFLSFFGVTTSPDSSSYINSNQVRTSGYPIIIQVFEIIFKDNGLLCLAYSQIFLWLYSSFYFSKEISSKWIVSNSKLNRFHVIQLLFVRCLLFNDGWLRCSRRLR